MAIKLKRRWRIFHDRFIQKRKLKFITWFFYRFKGKYCWTDAVSYAYSPYRFNPFKLDRSRGCEEESKTHSTNMCYCGGWNNGVCWDLLSKEQQEKERLERSTGIELEPSLPF